MKILYDSVSSEYLYPLSHQDVRKIRDYVPSEILNLVWRIRFGCNTRTPQEGRTVKRGSLYDIKVNFCLKRVGDRLQNRIPYASKEYIQGVKRYGGKPDLEAKTIEWEPGDAKRYAFFLLLHEIGHVVYAEKDLPGGMAGSYKKGSSKEEEWCDKYSAQLIKKMQL